MVKEEILNNMDYKELSIGLNLSNLLFLVPFGLPNSTPYTFFKL
jgi:hypothetical protein